MTDTLPLHNAGFERRYREPTLAEEIASSGLDPVIDMANLTQRRTGIEGIVFISTAMGAHGPRVKYFVRPGDDQPSFSVSIAVSPEVVANSLDARTLRRRSPEVIAWVRANHDSLRRFWFEGTRWTDDEVDEFKASLVRYEER